MGGITEKQLRSAAERAIAGGHAIAAILFGSRARGNSGPLSDWDVCLVTVEGARTDQARGKALEADDDFWDDGNIETVWLPRARFDRGVSAGTLEAAIAHEGKVLAGDASVAKKAVTVPFEAETVHWNMRRTSEHLFMSIEGARREAQESDEIDKADAWASTLSTSIAGAEALGRALCALTETDHTGSHRIGTNARRIADRANEAEPPLENALMNEISERVQTLNNTAQAARSVEYGGREEDRAKTVDRFVRALEADLWTRQGLIEGTGPWGGLKDHPRRGELAEELERRTARRAVRNARAGLREPLELADEKLDRAVREWVAGYQALLDVHRRREHENASANAQ